MADPVIPGGIRTLVVLQNANGLPEDRYVTTWCFEFTDTWNAVTHPAAIHTALVAFFNAPAGNSAIAARISGAASRGTNASKIISYWLGQEPERTPYTSTWTLGPQTTTGSYDPLPSEVALVTSFHSDKSGPRGRGRVYLGPLCVAAASASESGEARPADAFITAVNLAARGLANSAVLVDAGLMWSQLSQTDAEARPVIGGHTDNAFDTQRRRGLVTSARVNWTAA